MTRDGGGDVIADMPFSFFCKDVTFCCRLRLSIRGAIISPAASMFAIIMMMPLICDAYLRF